MASLGQPLRDARLAKGLSLADVERETHIARHYLEALEEENREALPAPVYARGFLRTYARYLALDDDALVRRYFPAAAPSTRSATPARAAGPAIDRRGWIVGGIVAAVFGFALVLGFRALTGGSGDGVQPPPGVGGQTDGPAGGRTLPVDAPTPGERPRTIDAPTVAPVQGGDMPDFRGRDVESALAVLAQLGVPYVVVETYSDRVEAGKILQQTPRPGANVDKNTSVTLVVSRGGTPTAQPR